MMYKIGIVISILLSGITLTLASTCCKTGYDTYTWCSDYCCERTYSSGLFDYCCSWYSRRVTYNSYSTYCDTWWADHVWAAVLIGLGSLAAFIGIIVCCVCCIKGCTASNRRTGTVLMNSGQPATGVFLVSNATGQQQQTAYQTSMQPGQAVYPPGYHGPSGFTGSTASAYPPPSYDSKPGHPV